MATLVSGQQPSLEREADGFRIWLSLRLQGFRDSKWWLGFKEARIADIRAWSRLFCLFAIAMLVLVWGPSCYCQAGRTPARSYGGLLRAAGIVVNWG